MMILDKRGKWLNKGYKINLITFSICLGSLIAAMGSLIGLTIIRI